MHRLSSDRFSRDLAILCCSVFFYSCELASFSEFDYPSAGGLFWVFRFLKVVVCLKVWSRLHEQLLHPLLDSHRSLAFHVFPLRNNMQAGWPWHFIVVFDLPSPESSVLCCYNLKYHVHKHMSTGCTILCLLKRIVILVIRSHRNKPFSLPFFWSFSSSLWSSTFPLACQLPCRALLIWI